jgi:hypothetical protein
MYVCMGVNISSECDVGIRIENIFCTVMDVAVACGCLVVVKNRRLIGETFDRRKIIVSSNIPLL